MADTNAVHLKPARAPSIRMLLGIGITLLLAPLGYSQLSVAGDARSTVTQTDAVIGELEELDELLRLGPAIMAESVAGTSAYGLNSLVSVVPDIVPESVFSDFVELERSARTSVDELLQRINNPEWSEQIAQVRADVASGDLELSDVSQKYERLRIDAEETAQQHVVELTKRSAQVLDSDALAPVTTALLDLSRLQTIEAARIQLWANVSVPVLPVAAEDIKGLGELESYYNLIVADVGDDLRENPTLQQLWIDHADTDAARELSRQTAEAIDTGIRSAVQDSADFSYEEFLAKATASSAAFTQFIEDLSKSVQEFGVRTDEGSVLRGQLFAEVETQARQARSQADAAEQAAILQLLGVALAAIFGVFIIDRFISKPARSMASCAQKLSDGDLTVDVPVQGPSELRQASMALNESIDSLRLVELQSVALANGDLDHPVLRESTNGELGASVHKAVDRLRDALSLNETFRSRLAHEAAHDGLTGLPNRKAIMEQIEGALARAQRSSTSVSLLFLDLDDFKEINDTYGHRTGDTLLRVVSLRIRSAIRTGDVAGRLGGDEFVVLAEGCADVTAAVELAERVRSAVLEPVVVDGVTLEPQVSIGVAMSNGNALTPDELIHDADLAVYRAKADGTSVIQVCDEELRAEFAERSNIESAIRSGLANDEFELYYQPTLDVSTGTVKSLEALIRWRRADGSLESPITFIPVAEQSNLIVSIDEWVLNTAARQLEHWNRENDFGDRSIAVNISGRHLASETLLTTIDTVLASYDISPHQLMLEITETAFLSDLEDATRQLAAVKQRGVRVALDDFGTGYMSLGVLRALPVDILKVDQSFVQRMDTPDEKALVQLIIGSGHILGMSITAEGVETEQQHQWLTDVGADVIQGYLFSHPLPAAEIPGLLDRYTRDKAVVNHV